MAVQESCGGRVWTATRKCAESCAVNRRHPQTPNRSWSATRILQHLQHPRHLRHPRRLGRMKSTAVCRRTTWPPNCWMSSAPLKWPLPVPIPDRTPPAPPEWRRRPSPSWNRSCSSGSIQRSSNQSSNSFIISIHFNWFHQVNFIRFLIEFIWDCSEIALKLLWNCSLLEIDLKLHQIH